METPKTLQTAIQFFSDYDNCRKFMIAVRWLDEVVRCPRCNGPVYLEGADTASDWSLVPMRASAANRPN